MPKPERRVAKNGNVSWFVRFRLDGRQTSEVFPTKKLADDFILKLRANGAHAAVRERAKRDIASTTYVPTLREWYEHVMTKLKSGITEGTRSDYDKIANRIMLPLLGDYPLDQIDRALDAQFIRALENAPRLNNRGNPSGGFLSPKTIRQHHGLLSDLLNWAVREDKLTSNPCRAARLPRAGEQNADEARFLTHPEWEAIYKALPDSKKALPLFLVGTGLRWSEATALEVRHVDLGRRTVRVVQAWKKAKKGGTRTLGPPKSNKSRRTVMLADQIAEALRPLIEGQPPDALVFRASRGGAIWGSSYHYRVWGPACIAAGVINPRPRLHDLRHTHASWLLEQGATIEQVQDQLGHEHLDTTRRVYGALQPSARAALQVAATAALDWTPEPLQIES